MFKQIILFKLIRVSHIAFSQLNPAITKWLQNTTVTGKYYVSEIQQQYLMGYW